MKIGLALAGGGLQGVAHIGVIKALNEIGIKADYISGTSSGSIFSLLYSMNFTPDEMKEILEKHYKELSSFNIMKILKIIKDFVIFRKIETEGLIDGKKIENLVSKIAGSKGIKEISDIRLPLAIATVDTISTKECIFLSNNCKLNDENIEYIYDVPIGKAVRASMAFPGIYTTCSYKKYNFIDGGTKDNLPIKVLKDMGADFTIGISFSIEHYEPSKNFFKVILRAVDLFSQKDVVNAQKLADIAIEIETEDTSLLEIDDIDKCIEIGYNAIKSNEENIKRALQNKNILIKN